MDPIIKYLKLIGYTIISILVITFILTLLNYYNIISNEVMNYLKFISIILSTFISGFKIGRRSTEKGWLAGLKLGLALIFILFLFTYLGLASTITIKNIIYYLIILLITTLGAMIGINKKETND
ncbi:MAG: TIGR04086 family membrane protein [Bacilli bacterium]|jgi:putative membrane protein (TIGR04086 family)